jgi:hypothetical protein
MNAGSESSRSEAKAREDTSVFMAASTVSFLPRTEAPANLSANLHIDVDRNMDKRVWMSGGRE